MMKLSLGPVLFYWTREKLLNFYALGVQRPEVELFAYGHLPLAYSARCFTARAENLPKDDCQFVCLNYPEGPCARHFCDLIMVNGPARPVSYGAQPRVGRNPTSQPAAIGVPMALPLPERTAPLPVAACAPGKPLPARNLTA